MGVCEVLEDVLARYEIFREHENNPIDLEGWQDLEQKFHFAVMIGQWKQHLRQDLNTYLTQDPPGQHTESARLLLSLLDSGTILYFEISFDGGTLSPDDSSWEFYREWLKMEAEVLGARPYCQANEIRMTTLIRWAQEDGFITQTEAEEYLSLVQPAQP
ncbi:hypothetical protein KKG41_04270 [Patescibacteria group bacterium]|nr:hypothetical protein [Patescibacteria group bacterium]